MQFLSLTFLFILGACLGSFACCEARRLHLRAEEENAKGRKRTQKSPTNAEPKKRTQKSSVQSSPVRPGNRSVCLSCGRQLKWYDNIPIVSWLLLCGRCRYCGAKIGVAELVAELASALVFLGIGVDYVFGPLAPAFELVPTTPSLLLPWLSLIFTLIFATLLIFLGLYDALYSQLPTLLLTFSIICAIIILILKYWSFFSSFSPNLFTSTLLRTPETTEVALLILAPIGAIAILGGTYLLLYLVSRGRWVGDGDWLLGTALGLALASPWAALLVLFLANALATVFVAPRLARGSTPSRKGKHSAHTSSLSALDCQIPLGPFLIAAYFLVTIFADFFAQIAPNML